MGPVRTTHGDVRPPTIPRMRRADAERARAGRAARPGASRRALSSGPDALLERLRPAGNAALSALLTVQRQDDEPAPLLTPAQIAIARRFYTGQPGLYTPAIVAQLRTALGLDGAGGVDDALVLAVATWQSTDGAGDPSLTVDGMAGPRTLPRIFRHGLNEAGEGERFGREVQKGVVDEWATLATAEARRDTLVGLVGDRLAAASVPAVTPAFDPDPTNAGSFNFPTWAMRVGREELEKPSLTQEEAAELADTVYHEARHTEQWFRMAQLRALHGLSARGIAAELGIPANIAQLAKDAPLAKGSMQAVIAQGWWDSVYGAGSAGRDAVLTELDRAGTALTKARERFDKDPTPANQKALDAATARNARAFARYRNLPEENDAWATGPAAAAGVTTGSPEPATPPPAGGPAHDVAPDDDLPGAGP